MTRPDLARLLRWWQQQPQAWRSQVWPGLLAVLAVLGLVLAFHGVVRGAVAQGELRRAATAAQTEAAWRCNTLGGVLRREACLTALGAPAPEASRPVGLALAR